MSEFDETMEVAGRFYNAGNYAAAERLCGDVLREKGADCGAFHLLGQIAYQLGRYEASEGLVEKAIAAGGGRAELYNTLGVVLEAQGRVEAAMEAYRHAVGLDEGYAEAWHNMAIAQQGQGDFAGAIECCGKAVSQRPGFARAYNTMGYCQRRVRRLEEAAESFRQAIRFSPNLAEAFCHLGAVLYEKGEYGRAIQQLRHAVRIAADYAEAWNNLGMALRAAGEHDEGVECFRRAVEADGEFLQAHYNLANALRERGEVVEAIECYRRAIELKGDFGWAHWNLSHALLLSGEFAEGWREYGWRHSAEVGIVTYPHEFDLPQWDGRGFAGKRLLVHYEQGLGDNIQFVRYLPMVKARGGTVVFEAPKELCGLLRGVAGIDEVIEAGASVPRGDFDFVASPLDLPGVFGTTMETVPGRTPYLFADEAQAEAWRGRLGGGFKVGIVWAGSPGHGRDAERSCSVEWFLRLGGIAGVRFFGLQKGAAREELSRCDMDGVVEDVSRELWDFSDTAAAIANMDLVICVDTAVGHLAGAMGKRVWVVLPFSPDWRWMLHGCDSVWYPAMRLFRQERRGDWEGVFRRVRGELEKAVMNNEYRTE